MTFRVLAPLNLDAYKNSHRKQYSPHTEVVYSTWTPRKSRMSGVDKVVFFGLQYFIKDYLIESFNETFFKRPKNEVIAEIKECMKNYLGDEDTSHWEELHDLGYLPLKICALPEGTLTPIRVPMFTIENTLPQFYWLTNFIETILSNEIWKPMTSATIALEYRKILDKWAEKTCDNNTHVDYQGHDFSYRGMVGTSGGASSGAGHLLSFKGTDTLPAVLFIEQYYNTKNINGSVGSSIPATEHSVAETNIIELQELIDKGEIVKDNDWDSRKYAELLYLERLLNVYETGFFSYVSDTYNLWEVIRDILPALKDKIMNRDGRVVIRPDSGDPCDILCGYNTKTFFDDYRGIDKPCNLVEGDYAEQINKGVIELLWDIFGGTINSKGYKVLDSHIGCIYGDAITLERAEEICKRLESKGFASSNVVLGIGSYTYNMNTRDTFGFALKTTYGVVNGKELLLYKDPYTDDGTKKSQKGRVAVVDEEGGLRYIDELYKDDIIVGNLLQPVFLDGKLLVDTNLEEIRSRLKVVVPISEREMYELRQYQKDILNKLWQSLKEHDKVLVSAPTGAGKTVMASALIHELVKRGHKVAFVVDSEELIKQTERTLNTTVSVVKAGYDKLFNADNPIQIIMLQTFFARANKLPDMNLDYIIIDECHIGWGQARINELLRIYSDAKIVGLSATPINSKGYLLEGFEDFINEVQTKDLIDMGYLAKPICYAPQNCVLDLSAVDIVGGEFNNKQVDEIVLDLNKVEQIVDNWEQVAKDKKTIVFANSIKHAEMIFREFLKRGYDDLGIIHSKIENLALKRQEMLSKQIIINCNVLTKGYDDKTIECVVLARPTNVLSLFLQIAGRGLRVTDTKKECLILDCANCISKHGLPDDYRFYQFAPKRDNEPEYQQCPECGNIERVGVKVCSVCGYDFTPIIESGSSKVSKKEIERLVKLHSAQEDLLKELRLLVKERGYKSGYSWWLFRDLLQNAKTQNTGMIFYKKIMRRIEKCRDKGYKIAWLKYQ